GRVPGHLVAAEIAGARPRDRRDHLRVDGEREAGRHLDRPRRGGRRRSRGEADAGVVEAAVAERGGGVADEVAGAAAGAPGEEREAAAHALAHGVGLAAVAPAVEGRVAGDERALVGGERRAERLLVEPALREGGGEADG